MAAASWQLRWGSVGGGGWAAPIGAAGPGRKYTFEIFAQGRGPGASSLREYMAHDSIN